MLQFQLASMKKSEKNVRGNLQTWERRLQYGTCLKSMATTTGIGVVEWRTHFRAHIAQLVERILGKDEVFGPIPNAGSIFQGSMDSRETTGNSMPFCLVEFGIFHCINNKNRGN